MKIKKEKIDELKEKGITQIASIVKSHFSTRYYNVVKISEIENNGYNWIPSGNVKSGWRGINGNEIDWSKTEKLANVR